MSTTLTAPEPKTNGNGNAVAKQNPAKMFRQQVTTISESILKDWVGEERAKEAIARVAAAFSASAAAAKDPRDFYACTPQSVAMCIAVSALTGIMPGVGPTALAYVLPQRPRRDEDPQLQYSLSHRGLNALARRCGQTMMAIPVSTNDKIQSSTDGDVELLSLDIDNPPTKFEELRGVMVVVKDCHTGVVLSRNWMPKKLIEARRAMSRSFTGKNPQYSPWSTWPIEMAMKTGMHYSVARGWCVIDDTSAQRALTLDTESDLKELPAPSGPSSVGDLANLIANEMTSAPQSAQSVQNQEDNAPAGTIDKLEPVNAGESEQSENAGEESQQVDSSPYLIGEKETSKKYTDRILKAVRESQSIGVLDAIGAAATNCHDKVKPEEWQAIDNALENRGQQLLQAQESGSLIS